MNHSIRLNDQIRVRGETGEPRYQVTDPSLRAGCIKVFDRDIKDEKWMEMALLSSSIVSGELVLDRPNAPRIAPVAQADPKLAKAIEEASKFQTAVVTLSTSEELSLHAAYGELVRRDCGGKPAPSRATFYRRVAAQRKGLPMLRGDMNKGNRRARYSAGITKLVQDRVTELYLHPDSQHGIQFVTDQINIDARSAGMLAEQASIGKGFVQKIVATLSPDPEIDRMDPKLVAANKSVARHRIKVTAPFARVEQDGLHLPYVVRTPHGTSSDVWLVHALDCGLSFPLGWKLVLGYPTQSDGLACVEKILFPKDAELARLGLSYNFLPYGTPEVLLFDNGPETKGARITGLGVLDIDVTHCKSRTPSEKPFIERFNRSLKEALEDLPGCTRKDGKDGARDPIALNAPLMTFEELEVWIVRWYFEEWIHTPLERHMISDIHSSEPLGNTPLQRLQTWTRTLHRALPLPPSRAAWQQCLYEREVCVLSRNTGISINKLSYRGHNLDGLVDRFGETSVSVLFNRDDYRTISVDAGDGELIDLVEEYVTDSTPAYTLAEYQAMVEEVKATAVVAPETKAFREQLHARVMQDKPKPRSKPRGKVAANRTVSDASKVEQAKQRAVAKPLPPKAQELDATSGLVQSSFEHLKALPIINRITREDQK